MYLRSRAHEKLEQYISVVHAYLALLQRRGVLRVATAVGAAGVAVREERGGEGRQEVLRHAHVHEAGVVVVEEEQELEERDGVLAQPAALLARLPLLAKPTVQHTHAALVGG